MFGPSGQSGKLPARWEGVIASAWYQGISSASPPSHGFTVSIGSDVYEFLDSGTGTVVANDAYIAVEIDADPSVTIDNWIAAINGTANAAHAVFTKADTVTPAIGIGSKSIVASRFEAPATAQEWARIEHADAQGGNAIPGAQSLVLTDGNGPGTLGWSIGNGENLNISGVEAKRVRYAHATLALNPEMAVSGSNQPSVSFPFEVSGFSAWLLNDAGGGAYAHIGPPLFGNTETTRMDALSFAVSGRQIFINGVGSIGTINAGDVLHFIAWE